MTSMQQKGSNSTPISDEDLQKITLGERKPHNAPITLVEYDPRWPELFDREANRIRSALGNKALRVEHVGSTSVPGLCAKPIIDMLLVVADSADGWHYPGLGDSRLHDIDPGARVVRAPSVQGIRYRNQPTRV